MANTKKVPCMIHIFLLSRAATIATSNDMIIDDSKTWFNQKGTKAKFLWNWFCSMIHGGVLEGAGSILLWSFLLSKTSFLYETQWNIVQGEYGVIRPSGCRKCTRHLFCWPPVNPLMILVIRASTFTTPSHLRARSNVWGPTHTVNWFSWSSCRFSCSEKNCGFQNWLRTVCLKFGEFYFLYHRLQIYYNNDKCRSIYKWTSWDNQFMPFESENYTALLWSWVQKINHKWN